jgi:Protein of unknown function (DUF3485)
MNMKSYLAPAIAGLLIVSTGLVQAYWKGAFGGLDDLKVLREFAERLPDVPIEIDDWEGKDEGEMDEREREVAEADAALARRYVNRLTGQAVSVSLVSGKFRGIAQHVPTQCYVAAGYTMHNPEIQYKVETDAGPVECYTTVFKKDEHTRTTYLRVFWTWSYDGRWVAPQLPRVALVGQPALYKLYFITEILQPGQPIEQNASVDFMRKFIPAANAVLFPDAAAPTTEPTSPDAQSSPPAAS